MTRHALDTMTADAVNRRLECAGATLLALPPGKMHGKPWSPLAAFIEGAAPGGAMRPSVPCAWKIDLMDEALGWLALIPNDRVVLRRIVGARLLVNPVTGRHLYPWRRLETAMGADHKAVQRWHAQGIAMIVSAINAQQTERRAA